MSNSIVVYRIMSERDGVTDMNISHAMAQELIKMGIIFHSHPDYEVIREGETTVTVYSHRRVDSI